MTYQILFKDAEGRNFVYEAADENDKLHFARILDNTGITYDVIARDNKKYQVVTVIFKLEDAELNKTYTFADPDKLAKVGNIVEVQCTDGRKKPVYVMSTEMKSVSEIRDICTKIGYPKLGRVVRKIR